jgi:hypothetical protein
MASTLQFRVHTVRCVDETGGQYAERFGNDEIHLGGHSILQDGTTSPIHPFSVYPHFDDGDVKVYDPPRVFHEFALGASFPQEFGIGMTLIEKDAGGMVDAVRKIADKVGEEVQKRLESAKAARKADMTRKAASEDGRTRALGPVLSYAIAAAAPYVIDWVKRTIISAFSDDIFQPQHATVMIPSASFDWSGSPSSAISTAVFRDHSGVYYVTFDWNLV